MAKGKKNYDNESKLRAQYNLKIDEQQKEIALLKEKLEKAESKVDELRKRLHDAGEGKGERNRLQRIINTQERENRTLSNKLEEQDGSKYTKVFSEKRQKLIKNIRNLNYSSSVLTFIRNKFNCGLDDAIMLSYLIKTKKVQDVDYYTYVFRDSIISLFEKFLRTILAKHEDSASKFMVKLTEKKYKFPDSYLKDIPALKKEEVLQNMLWLVNLESTGYHGTAIKNRTNGVNKETKEVIKKERFLNLSADEQLTAIFTLLEFMYNVCTNKDSEQNLTAISSSWYKTL